MIISAKIGKKKHGFEYKIVVVEINKISAETGVHVVKSGFIFRRQNFF